MNKFFLGIFVLGQLFWVICADAAGQAQSRYFTLNYGNREMLREFNDQLELGSKLNRYMQKTAIVTVEDEALAKLNVLIEKAQAVLDMFPDKLHITVVLLSNREDVSAMFMRKYGKQADHIAYYSLSEDTIYVSVEDASLRVLAHELGHAIVDHYFQQRPPYHIHELMAQFTEKHITD
jgi:hypothetical protein